METSPLSNVPTSCGHPHFIPKEHKGSGRCCSEQQRMYGCVFSFCHCLYGLHTCFQSSVLLSAEKADIGKGRDALHAPAL